MYAFINLEVSNLISDFKFKFKFYKHNCAVKESSLIK